MTIRSLCLRSFLLLCCVAPAGAEPVVLHRSGDSVAVMIGGTLFTTYNFDPLISKAYMQPLRSASGVVVSRDFPDKTSVPAEHLHDRGLEPHQRPLYFAHGDINGSNFWAESAFTKFYPASLPSNFGRMVFHWLDEVKDGASSGTIRASFDLVGSDGKKFATEEQVLIFRGDGTTRSVDCTITVRALAVPVRFGDTKEGSFALRLAPSLTEPQGTMMNSAGQTGEKEIWGKRADWIDVYGVVDGHKVGVAIFDSPKNLRHPTYWHARGYGLLAANPFGLSYFLSDPKQDGSYTIAPGRSLSFDYRVLIYDGELRRDEIAARYSEFAQHQ